MLGRMFGLCWIAAGVFLLGKPQWLKSRLTRQGIRKMRGVLVVAGLFLGCLLMAASREISGFAGTLVLGLGLISIIKAGLLVKGKVSEKMLDWLGQMPVFVFRLGALGYILLGLFLVWKSGR